MIIRRKNYISLLVQIYIACIFNAYAFCHDPLLPLDYVVLHDHSSYTIELLEKLTGLSHEEVEQIMHKLDNLEALEHKAFGPYHHVLPRLIEQFNLKVGCEIGVSIGLHSYKILSTTEVTKLYSVDPYKEYPDSTNLMMKQKQFDIFYERVKNKLSVFGDRSKLMRLTSAEAAQLIGKESLDFVFIDANHEYDYVRQDLELWYGRVRKGGLIVGDDYTTHHQGVRKAVDEFFEAKNLRVITDSEQPRIWWVQKI